MRQRFEGACRRPLSWIAVVYADQHRAGSPGMEEILEAAIGGGCRGILWDTFEKSEGRLLDFLSLDRLRDAVSQARAAGLLTAVAGRLRAEDVEAVLPAGADLIAVRSAACREGNRTGRVDRSRVAALVDLLTPTPCGVPSTSAPPAST